MKKIYTFKRTLLTTTAVAALLAGQAFAVNLPDDLLISPSPQTNTDGSTNTDIAELQYHLVTGTVTGAEIYDKDFIRITLETDTSGLICNVKKQTQFLHPEDGSVTTAEDIQEGMEVAALVSNSAPMTMSEPPMTNGVHAFIEKTEGTSIVSSFFDSDYVNKEHTLMLNIGENTVIRDLQGSKKIYGAEDIKEKEAVVVYGASTRSIPAQTTPDMVILITEETMSNPEPEVQESQKVFTDCALRDFALEQGFSITWTGNDKPVLLTKDNIEVQLEIGKPSMIVDKDMVYELDKVPSLVDSKIQISAATASAIAGL